MLTYLTKRAILSIISIFLVITIVFFIMKGLDGLPISKQLHESDASFESRLAALGLSDPLGVQFGNYLKGLFHGNYGVYYSNPSITVNQIVMQGLPYTFIVMAIVYVFTIFFGVGFGIIAAKYHGSWIDATINFFTTLLNSIPLFVLMAVFVWLLSSGGISSRFYALNTAGFTPAKLINAIWPIIILTIVNIPSYIYFTRNEMIDVLNQDYMKVALFKGNSESRVLFKHGLRNALSAIIYLIIPGFITVISGSVMTETFFGMPGYATILVNAVQIREYNVVLYQALIFSSLYYAGSIVTDFVVTLIDPRIKLANESWDSYYSQTKYFLIRHFRLFYLNKVVFVNKYLELKTNSLLAQELIAQEAFKKYTCHVNVSLLENGSIPIDIKYLIFNHQIYRIIHAKNH